MNGTIRVDATGSRYTISSFGTESANGRHVDKLGAGNSHFAIAFDVVGLVGSVFDRSRA